MSDLFKIEPSLSPRLAWFKNHNVKTHEFDNSCNEKANHVSFGRWIAYVGKMPRDDSDGIWACAETEDEAVVRIAKSQGWMLWNEESAAVKPLNSKNP